MRCYCCCCRVQMCTWPSYVAQPYAFGFSYRHFISAKVILMLTLHFPPFMPHRVSPRRSYISLAITRTYFLLAFRAYFDWRTLQLCFGHTMKRSLLHLATTFVLLPLLLLLRRVKQILMKPINFR